MPEDFPTVVVEVWPENWLPLQVFCAMRTQWNEGFNGRTGFRYEALREIRFAYGIKSADWPDVFDAIRVMEAAALELFREKQ